MSGYASTFAVSAAVLLGAAFLAFFAARADTTPAGSPNPPQRNTPMTTHAYGAHAADQPLEPLPIPRRAVGPDDVQINIPYCGLCHSDIHPVRSAWAGTQYPCVPGHADRQSVVSGHSVTVRLRHGGL